MKKTPLLLFLLFTIITGFSQIKVSGTLIDSVTHQPIQYSRISFGDPHNAVLSDKNGYFEISYFQTGKVQISNVQYEPKEFNILQNENLGEIPLTNQVYKLNTFTINPNKSNLIAGEFEKRTVIKRKKGRYFFRALSPLIISLYIDSPNKNEEMQFIETLNYYICDSSKDGYPFRVQVYEAIPNSDGTVSHGKPLIAENIILSFPNYDGWIQLDVKKYGLKIPPNGIFISLEFLKSYPIDLDFDPKSKFVSTVVDFKKKDNCFFILFSKRSKSNPSHWTQSVRNFYGFTNSKFFGDSNNWGFLNVGNPLIYINYSIN